MSFEAFVSMGLFGAGVPLLQEAILGLDPSAMEAEAAQAGIRYGAQLSSATVASATLRAVPSATAIGAPTAQATQGDLPSSAAVGGPEVGAGAAISPGPRTAAVAHYGRTRGVTYG